jgi:hypothetical protein
MTKILLTGKISPHYIVGKPLPSLFLLKIDQTLLLKDHQQGIFPSKSFLYVLPGLERQ